MSTNFFIIQGNTITDIAYFKNPWILVTWTLETLSSYSLFSH
jgi:hypothetical protein